MPALFAHCKRQIAAAWSGWSGCGRLETETCSVPFKVMHICVSVFLRRNTEGSIWQYYMLSYQQHRRRIDNFRLNFNSIHIECDGQLSAVFAVLCESECVARTSSPVRSKRRAKCSAPTLAWALAEALHIQMQQRFHSKNNKIKIVHQMTSLRCYFCSVFTYIKYADSYVWRNYSSVCCCRWRFDLLAISWCDASTICARAFFSFFSQTILFRLVKSMLIQVCHCDSMLALALLLLLHIFATNSRDTTIDGKQKLSNGPRRRVASILCCIYV